MRGYIGVTDYDWFAFLRAIKPPIDEVNFWRPGSETQFKALQSGEPFFFRLKSPRNVIGGFAYFSYFSTVPTRIAWNEYGSANGAASYDEFRSKLLSLRARKQEEADFSIGCVLLTQSVFFEESDWVRLPSDYARSIQQGKTYDLAHGEGERMWLECLARSAKTELIPAAIADLPLVGGYGEPILFRPRLGQHSFRIAILDSYGRRCAVTNERTLPALEAAHIREYRDVPEHSISNGILLRADIHRLFDNGYVTVTPDHCFEVSKRIKEEFENGRDYYKLKGLQIRLPEKRIHHPAVDALRWHNENRYPGIVRAQIC
jgi:putative restriction endonuclease